MIANPENEDPLYLYKEGSSYYKYVKKAKREWRAWHLLLFLTLFGVVFMGLFALLALALVRTIL